MDSSATMQQIQAATAAMRPEKISCDRSTRRGFLRPRLTCSDFAVRLYCLAWPEQQLISSPVDFQANKSDTNTMMVEHGRTW
jgi:hypothetical protein